MATSEKKKAVQRKKSAKKKSSNKGRSRSPKPQNQTEIDEVTISNKKIEGLLEAREETKKAAAANRKASVQFAEAVAEDLAEYEGQRVRVGRFVFDVISDPGGEERQGYTTRPGIKPKKIQVVAGSDDG